MRHLYFLLSILLISLLSFHQVSAVTYYELSYQVQKALDQFLSLVSPFFEAIIGDYAGSEYFFAKVLLLILLFMMVLVALSKVPTFENQRAITRLIALIVAVLSVRFMSDELVAGILLPYNVLGVALTAILPFMLFFFFVHFSNMAGPGRRLSWIFFGIVFLVLWFNRSDAISPEMNQIYGWTLVAIVLVMIFDKSIHYYFKSWEIMKFKRSAAARTIAALQAEYLNIINVNTRDAATRRAQIEADLTRFGGKIP